MRNPDTSTTAARGIGAPAVVALVAAAVAFAVFVAAMAYPWQLAVLVATAIGALVYSTHTTWKRMRRLYRPPDAGDLDIGGRRPDRREDD